MGDETKLVKTVDVGVIEFAPDAKAVDTDATGYVRARLAKLGVVDLDNDIIEPGALKGNSAPCIRVESRIVAALVRWR